MTDRAAGRGGRWPAHREPEEIRVVALARADPLAADDRALPVELEDVLIDILTGKRVDIGGEVTVLLRSRLLDVRDGVLHVHERFRVAVEEISPPADVAHELIGLPRRDHLLREDLVAANRMIPDLIIERPV